MSLNRNTRILGLTLAILSIGLAAVSGQAQEEPRSSVFVSPIPLKEIVPVELPQAVVIRARGKPQKHLKLWLLVSRPTLAKAEPTNAAPLRKQNPDLPPLLPVLHVNEYRAHLAWRDPETGVTAW